MKAKILIMVLMFMTIASAGYCKTYEEAPESTAGLKILCGKQADGTVTPFLVGSDGTWATSGSGSTEWTDAGTRLETTDAAKDVRIDGDLSVDTTTLVVDATNNRVGIGTASPDALLKVAGNATVTGNLQVDGELQISSLQFSGGTLATSGNLNHTGDMTASGYINGDLNVMFVAADTTLSGAQMMQVDRVYVTSAAVVGLTGYAGIADPAKVDFSVIEIGAIEVKINPALVDLLVLDGTAQTDGEEITSTSTAGDIAQISYYNTTGWYAATNTWTQED